MRYVTQFCTNRLCDRVSLLSLLMLLAIGGISFVSVGCSGTDESEPVVIEGGPPILPGEESAHDHSGEGPNGGMLVELGNGTFHGELVEGSDDLGAYVAILILSEDLNSRVDLETTAVRLNLRIEDVATQMVFAAEPEEDKEASKSSRFVLRDESELSKLRKYHGEATLVVDRDGKQFRGKFAHLHLDPFGH